MNKKVIVIGDSCESKVVQNIIIESGDIVHKVLHSDKEIKKYDDCEYVIAIGSNQIRKKIYEEHQDLKYYTAIHPQARIDKTAVIEDGCIIHSGAFVNHSCKIGKQCLIGTNAIIEHCNLLEDFVNVGCGAVLSGDVIIRQLTQVSLNASIVNGVHINKKNLIGAGAVVHKSIIQTNGVYVGCPAERIRDVE